MACGCTDENLMNQIDQKEQITINYTQQKELSLQELCQQHKLRVKRVFAKANLIKQLHQSVFNCMNIKELYLPNNRIERIPEDISLLANLEYLNFESNYLCTLPCGLTNLSQLKKLVLRCNKLTCLPSRISDLSNLLFLDLSFNSLSRFPTSVCSCKNLKKLWLSNNNISSVPYDICCHCTLQEISLASNNIHFLPPDLGRNPSLLSVGLSENSRLEAIPIHLWDKISHMYCTSSMNVLSSRNGSQYRGMKLLTLRSRNDEICSVNVPTGAYSDDHNSPLRLKELSVRSLSHNVKAFQTASFRTSPVFTALSEYLGSYCSFLAPKGHCTACKKLFFDEFYVTLVNTMTFGFYNDYVINVLAYFCSKSCMQGCTFSS